MFVTSLKRQLIQELKRDKYIELTNLGITNEVVNLFSTLQCELMLKRYAFSLSST